MAPLRIEVVGESTIYRPAERAVLFITVQSEGESQTGVSQNVTETAANIRGELVKFAGTDEDGDSSSTASITHWSSSSLSTASYLQYDDQGQQSGRTRLHRASVSFEVKFRDFQTLGRLATSLSQAEFVTISRIEWRLTDKTAASLASQCRHQAIRDAVTKAADYALALARPTPPVVEVRDSGRRDVAFGQSARMVAAYHAEDSRDELNFKPEDVSLDCSVLVICEEEKSPH